MSARGGERGTALVMVLVALLVLTPLATAAWVVATAHLRRSTASRDVVRARYAVHGGLEIALAKLRKPEDLPPDTLRMALPAPDNVIVKIVPGGTVIVGLDGKLRSAEGASQELLKLVAIDPERRRYRSYVSLQTWVVECVSRSSTAAGAVRLVAVVAKTEDGAVHVLGSRYDRLASLPAGG
jgi:hypothetical protein